MQANPQEDIPAAPSQPQQTIHDILAQARRNKDKATVRHLQKIMGITTRWRSTKGVKGAFGGKRRIGVCPKPTHTDLRRMLNVAKEQDNVQAGGIIMRYANGSIDFEQAHADLLTAGFTSFGYRRGFVQ